MRTAGAYTRTLRRFFGTAGKTPEQVSPPDVFGFAPGIGPSGKEPAAITIGARLACISSFYRFLIRMEIVTRNPCGQLERPKVSPSLLAADTGIPATGQRCSVTFKDFRGSILIRKEARDHSDTNTADPLCPGSATTRCPLNGPATFQITPDPTDGTHICAGGTIPNCLEVTDKVSIRKLAEKSGSC